LFSAASALYRTGNSHKTPLVAGLRVPTGRVDPYTSEFTVIIPDVDDDTIDAIAGKCPDSGVGTCEGTTFVEFDREAKSLGEAIDTAVADLETISIKPIRVVIDMPQPATP
jgi:hypothetical protein